MKSVVVMFAKFPEVGKVKTRLAKAIGHETAATLYEKFVRKLIDQHRGADYDFVIAMTPGDKQEEFAQLFSYDKLYVQSEGNLGDRLKDVFDHFIQSYERVIVIGSDLPTLKQGRIHDTLYLLDQVDVVIGPSQDGGYYLLGMKKSYDVFSDIEWSTEKVLKQTMEHINSLELSYRMLLEERDIDTKEDLEFHGISIDT